MNEKLLLAYLRYNGMCTETYRQKLHTHPDAREVETRLFREFMQIARQRKLVDVN